MPASTKFHWKVFVSFYVVFSFLALAVSGIVLYVAPPGRVANWSVWQLLFLTKAQWQAVHTIVALAFLVAGAFHVYFNWKVLVAYLKSKLQSGLRMKRELAAASLTGVAILAVSMTGVPPFGTVMDVGEEIKNSWSTSSSEPPVPHAELMTVEKLAETVKIPVAKALANLEAKGVKGAQPTMIVQQVADENGLTPQQVYQRIQSEDAKPKVSMAEGGGWGRMSVQQVCERYSIPVETGVARLQAAGFDVQAAAMIRDLASARGKTPIDIAKIVVGDDGTIPSPEAAGPGVTGGPGRGSGRSRQ
ncbi:MAG TPA: DUF4405 domain-containing protein [Vicinamibacterales bacterium]|nr:DUF4405 domain-containing protein [Vicinamibacterales bacterium]